MTRVLLLMAFMAAGPCALAEDIPVPPIPPANQQVAEAAPVPNEDTQAPLSPVSDAPSVDVRFYRARTFDPSAGFVPGSRYQSSEDRKPIQTPGFSITVPLK